MHKSQLAVKLTFFASRGFLLMATSSQWLPPHKATCLAHQNNSTMLKALFIFIGAIFNLPHLNVLFFFQCAFQKLAEEPYKRQKYLKIVKCTLNLTIERKVNLY